MLGQPTDSAIAAIAAVTVVDASISVFSFFAFDSRWRQPVIGHKPRAGVCAGRVRRNESTLTKLIRHTEIASINLCAYEM